MRGEGVAASTRRRVLSGVAAAAGLLAGVRPSALAAPVRASTKTTVVWTPWYPTTWSSTLVSLFREAAQAFLQAHPSIDLQFVPGLYPDAAVAQVIAGQAPDVVGSNYLGPYLAAGAAIDLTAFVKQYDVDLSVFPAGRVQYWRTAQGLWAMPLYRTNLYGYIINLGALDEMGIAYPPADWDYQDALRLFRAATRKTAAHPVTGGKLMDSNLGANLPAAFYLVGFGGTNYQDPNDLARCNLDTPGAIKGGEFWYGAILEGIATFNGDASCFPPNLPSGTVVADNFGSCDMVDIAAKLRSFKWDFWPMPRLPMGRFTVAGPDGLLITSTCKHVDAAWEFLYWVTVDPTWTRWNMRTLLGPPTLNALWDEYAAVVRAVAPPLRDKNLEVIGASAPGIILDGTFTYADATADAILNHWGGQILARKVSVAEGFAEAARQVNALEAASRGPSLAEARRLSAVKAALAHASAVSGNLQFPFPARAGSGPAPRPAARGAVRVKSGVYIIEGTGGGIAGTDDGCTALLMPWTSSRGTFSCRLVAIRTRKGQQPATGAKVGLMARGDLGGSAAMVAVEVAIDRGLHLQSRPFPGAAQGDQQPGSGPPGLIPAGTLLAPSSGTVANYLLRPIWLRLERRAASWLGYTSSDGRVWTQAGFPVGITAEGVWVGIFATPHAGPPAAIETVFDHLSFEPREAYQLG